MARGRPRKAGKRERNGRLQRDASQFDRGSEWVQKMRDRYGEHYSSPIGRLYASGLLGEEEIARVRYDVGKKFARLYARLIERPYRCALDTTPRLRVVGDDMAPDSWAALEALERDQAEQGWLFEAMDKLDRAGLRPWLDQIVCKRYTDTGPYWVDALLSGGHHPADQSVLDAAIRALDEISPPQRAPRILVA